MDYDFVEEALKSGIKVHDDEEKIWAYYNNDKGKWTLEIRGDWVKSTREFTYLFQLLNAMLELEEDGAIYWHKEGYVE